MSKNKKLIKTAEELKKEEEVCIRFPKSFALARIIKTGLIKKDFFRLKITRHSKNSFYTCLGENFMLSRKHGFKLIQEIKKSGI